MADLKPIGSEKLQGDDKIKRILEIARYKEMNNNINEGKNADYSIELPDGKTYGIVHEKMGYIIKRGINESEFDYIEPIENRKYYKSYSQAMKKLNLITGEINRLTENKEGIQLLGEKKYTLKTPKSKDAGMSDMGGDTATLPPPPPPPAGDASMDALPPPPPPAGDASMDALPPPPPPAGDDGMDMGSTEGDMDIPMGGEMGGEGDMEAGGEEETSFKLIQKLTGKLGQKLRTLDEKEGLTSENIKYVLNSIISAIDLENLSEEDKEDVLSNFEEDEIDYGIEDDLGVGDDAAMDIEMGDDDLGNEELQEYDIYAYDDKEGGAFDLEGNGIDFDTLDDVYRFDFKPKDYDMDFDEFKSKTRRRSLNPNPHDDTERRIYDFMKRKHGSPRLGTRKNEGFDPMLDEIFSESKIDKVLSKYYDKSENEIVEEEQKSVKKFLTESINKVNVKKEIKRLSETIEQQNTAEFIINQNPKMNFVGKTNLGNLVFENKNEQIKISKGGELL